MRSINYFYPFLFLDYIMLIYKCILNIILMSCCILALHCFVTVYVIHLVSDLDPVNVSGTVAQLVEALHSRIRIRVF